MKKNLSFLVMFLLLIVATGSNAFAQKQELSGTILNSDGLPIQFASIQVREPLVVQLQMSKVNLKLQQALEKNYRFLQWVMQRV
jgi:hypothetical protein